MSERQASVVPVLILTLLIILLALLVEMDHRETRNLQRRVGSIEANQK